MTSAGSSNMVIFFGGYIGSGKTIIAKAIAEKIGILYYEVDAVKKEVVAEDSRLQHYIRTNIPFPDEARIKMFLRVVDDFGRLCKTHKCIIVDETLHKKSLRGILYEGARRYFGGYIVVWIQASEATIKERLMNSQRVDHVLGDAYGMYLSMKKSFDDLDEADIVFENNGSVDDAAEILGRMIEAKITDSITGVSSPLRER
jgi:dephospho-CoA kinase